MVPKKKKSLKVTLQLQNFLRAVHNQMKTKSSKKNKFVQTEKKGRLKRPSLEETIEEKKAMISNALENTVPDKTKINNEQANKIIERLAIVHGICKYLALVARALESQFIFIW